MSPKPLDTALLSSVAEQLMSGNKVEVGGQTLSVQRTIRNRFRCVKFSVDGAEFEAIEQNAAKPSRWGELARAGHRIVQFRETGSGRYVAVAVDGKVTVYGH
jgi:DNA replicative helicase MCM subunit Mcm2 (Cdc46/Mcm family)